VNPKISYSIQVFISILFVAYKIILRLKIKIKIFNMKFSFK